VNGMSYFSDEKRFEDLIEKPKDISTLLKKDMFLISGDFYGIQKFIFDRLSTKNASKVLRAKSAFIQIFTEYLARYICKQLEIDENSILSMNAGKLEILSDKEIELDAIQKKIDEFKELIVEMKGEETMPTLAQRWLDEGKAEGIQIGMQRGIETGMQQGIQTGIQTGIFETAIVMIKDFQIAIDDVVAKLNIKKEELLEYMKKKSV